MSPLGLFARLAWGGCLATSLVGCNLDEGGIDPTPGTLNLPVAVALSPTAAGEAPEHLFVVNSNMDHRFNEGTLMAFDLDEVERMIGPDCTSSAPCALDALEPFLVSEIGVGSDADGLSVSPDGDRVYVASRARQNLTFVNWDGQFQCETKDEDDAVKSCVDQGTVVAGGRELELDGDPVAVTSGRLADVGGGNGNFVLLALRDGQVALYIDEEGPAPDQAPRLVHIAKGFPDSVVTITMQPGTGIGWLTSAATRQLGRVGIAVDPAEPLQSFLYDAGAVTLGGLDTGVDSRDLQFDPTDPGGRALVLTRRPEAVVALDLARMGLNARDVAIDDVFEVGQGPSRLAIGTIAGKNYALATTFDGRKMFVIDVELGALIAVVGGFSGPFELAIDEARQRAYVVDFPVSVIRIVDLEPLARGEAPYIEATLGRPTPVEDFTN